MEVTVKMYPEEYDLFREYQREKASLEREMSADYLAVTNKIAQDFMTVYAVVIAFYFGTQTQREQSATDGTQTTEEGK